MLRIGTDIDHHHRCPNGWTLHTTLSTSHAPQRLGHSALHAVLQYHPAGWPRWEHGFQHPHCTPSSTASLAPSGHYCLAAFYLEHITQHVPQHSLSILMVTTC